MWYLLMTGKAVKGETLSGVETGYSCIADRIGEREYYEVFKYATKLWSEDKYVINYDCFCVLYSALYRRRITSCIIRSNNRRAGRLSA